MNYNRKAVGLRYLARMTSPLVLEGTALAKSNEVKLATRVEALTAVNGGRTPILATILVGDDPSPQRPMCA